MLETTIQEVQAAEHRSAAIVKEAEEQAAELVKKAKEEAAANKEEMIRSAEEIAAGRLKEEKEKGEKMLAQSAAEVLKETDAMRELAKKQEAEAIRILISEII